MLQPLNGVRQKSESDAAIQACNDYLRMGSGRKISTLIQDYSNKIKINKRFVPPTDSIGTLYQWSVKFNWDERSSEYDATWEARKNEERLQVFNQALALDFGRVRELIELAEFLKAQLYEQDEDGNFHNVWNPDVKGVGQGNDAIIVDIEKFNPAIIEQYRATLADIAKEVGGRVTKQEVTGKDGGAIKTEQINVNINAENAHDAGNILKQLAELGAIPPARSESGHDSEAE